MQQISIKACGLVTAVGFNSASSLAAIRAGIHGVKEENLWDWDAGEFLSAGKVDLPQWWEGLGKLADLVAPAIQECLNAAKPTDSAEIPILLGVAAKDRPYRLEGLDGQLLEEVEYKLNLNHHPMSTVIPMGRVSLVKGIQLAAHYFKTRQVPLCIIAGVDSFLDQEVVEAYMDQRRILTTDNSNGFIPGEAGSAVLLASTTEAAYSELSIKGIGIAKESASINSEEPLKGNGLAEAIAQALDDAETDIYNIRYRITDLNGEHYKFKEASLAATRFMHKPVKWTFDLWHPIEFVGDVGSAIGPLALAIALHANQKGYSISTNALCHFSNDDGYRGAVVVEGQGDVT